MMHFPPAFSIKEKVFFLLIFPALVLYAGFMVQKSPVPVYAEGMGTDFHVLASVQGQPTIPESAVPSQAEIIMRTLSAAYSDRIGPVEFRNGDWAFPIGRRWFYYAEGRILPEDRRNRIAEYRALGFNSNYQVELPSWESTAEQRAARTRTFEEGRANRQPAPRTEARPTVRRPNYFFEALWDIRTRDEAWAQQETVSFLGHRLTIHSGISDIINRLNVIIMNESRTNLSVRQWINSLGTITGWNWRNVASSGNRSFHSYGIAIDILPRDLRGQATYCLWSSQHTPQWWNIPYSGRWHPPDEVIKAFESYGFIWGGKWSNFDTMHFEYRPEIFILSNIPINW